MASKPIAHNLDSKWRSQDVKIQESADFSSLLLSNKLLAGLKHAGYQSPSPIQIKAVPIGRFGKDLVVQAKSGTGKTLVFTIVALEMILPDVTQPQVLIIAPTREIAHQICSVIQAVGCEFKNLNCCTFIGGIPISDDRENISGCQIAVGTPGRIKQLIKEGILKTNCIRLFVLDEADQLLEASFLGDVDEIFLTLPKDKQVIAASATYPQKLKKLADRYFRNPYLARLNIDELALLGIVHYVQTVDVSDMPVLVYKKKLEYLAKILTSISFSQCLVFCNLLSRVPTLTSDIKDWGFTTTSISSNKEQVDRLKAIDKLKLFKCKVLVSSDLTARGIDAENVNLVVNFDLPLTTETYLHRVGRAGRYGSRGIAVTLLLPKQSEAFKTMESSANFSSYDLPDPIPQNLMNIRPQGFQGPEDGFDTSSENSEIPDEGTGNQNSVNCGAITHDSECTETESVISDFCQRQKELSDGNNETNFEESMNSGLCLSKNGQNDEKECSLESAQGEKEDFSTCLEQKGASDENRKIDSPQNIESENQSAIKTDESEGATLLDNGSIHSENSDLYAGVASFLSQIQPTDSLTDTISGNQTKESSDVFYYQVFKSFADENIPEAEGVVPSNETDIVPSNETDIVPSNGTDIVPSNETDIVPSNETDIESKPVENDSFSVYLKEVFNITEKGYHEGARLNLQLPECKYSDSSSSESDLADFDFGSDSHSSVGIRYSSYSSSTSEDSEPLTGLLNGKSGAELPFTSDYMVKGPDGWTESKLDQDALWKRINSTLKLIQPTCRQEESITRENDHVPAHSLDNEVPEFSKTENVPSSSGHAQMDLECNPEPHKSTDASPAKSGNSVAFSPFADGYSHSCSPCKSSDNEKSSYSSKGSKYGRSQKHQTNSEREQRARKRNQPRYDQTHNNFQSHPICNWHLQPEANAISSYKAFDMGYNSYACNHNCSHHRSCDTHFHTNRQTFQNHCNSGNHSSSSNLWYDTFSKQWQHINNMCYFHQ